MRESAHAPLLTRIARLALGAVLLALTLGAKAPVQGRCRAALEYGLNPSFQNWSSRAIVFADAFQRVRDFSFWNNGPQGRAPLIPLDSGRAGAGWPDPSQLPTGARYGSMLFGSMEGSIPDGRTLPFVVTWKGRGHVRLEGPFVLGELGRTAQRVEVTIDPARGGGDGLLSVSWTATDPADPVRDVHVWLPGMEQAGLIFWPPFVERVRATCAGRGPATWRTLDWTRVNEYGRPLARGGFLFDLLGVITPASPTQGTLRGVAPEYQVAFCNELGLNLHFQVPHRTNDLAASDYLAFVSDALVRIRDGSPGIPGLFGGRPFAGLRPDLTVTLELSNEIWNSGFPVNAWMNAEATRKGLTFAQQVAGEIQLVFDAARAVFAGPDEPRLRTFVGGFGADPGHLRRVLAALRAGTRIDAVGPAAYLGPRRADMDAWLAGSTSSSCPNCPDEDGLIATLERIVDVLRPQLEQHRNIASSWSNPDGSHPALELYETGINLKSIGQPWAATARAIQDDPRLFTILSERLVPMLVEEGVSLANWYSFMTDQDSTLVDAYGLWNDMNQVLSQPVTRPYVHEGVPKAAAILLGPPLAGSCPPATVALRSPPTNADTLRASPAHLGGRLELRVDLTQSANPTAFVMHSLTPASVRLSTGQVLLVSFDDADFLPLRGGPIASWSEPVPNDPRIAGVRVSLQAIEVGGPTPVLTNAVDVVLGL
jgi:hypothetical protein